MQSLAEDVRSLWEPALRGVDAQLARIHSLVALGDAESHVSPQVAYALRDAFDKLVHAFDRSMREQPDDALAARVRDSLAPLARRSDNARRWCDKPRGYAGDYLMIARMYDDVASGEGPAGSAIDRCFLDLPAVRAVQNRRALLAGEIRASLRAGKGRVTSLACGPAREVFDVGPELGLSTTLVDFDAEALGACAAEAARTGANVELVRANLIHVAVGRRSLALPPQDLVYSICLIDYLDDALVVRLLDWIHATLAPGGRTIVGNFHPRNPTRAVMDHLLDWKLIHRDEAHMNRLFEASAFGAPCTRIAYEAEGINLFAEGVKRC
jgi:extracellular factor (EF) 3-hydroxypalmitic acid methyl ester biosynthesis protein